MEKCKICNKISYNLNNGFCKKCSKVNQGNIDICTQCNKITAYNIDDLCIECSKGTMTTEAIISKLEIKDPAKLSTLLRIGEKTIIQIAEQLKIENCICQLKIGPRFA